MVFTYTLLGSFSLAVTPYRSPIFSIFKKFSFLFPTTTEPPRMTESDLAMKTHQTHSGLQKLEHENWVCGGNFWTWGS